MDPSEEVYCCEKRDLDRNADGNQGHHDKSGTGVVLILVEVLDR